MYYNTLCDASVAHVAEAYAIGAITGAVCVGMVILFKWVAHLPDKKATPYISNEGDDYEQHF